MIELNWPDIDIKYKGHYFAKLNPVNIEERQLLLILNYVILSSLRARRCMGSCVGYALLQKKHRRIPATVGDGNIWQIVNETPPWVMADNMASSDTELIITFACINILYYVEPAIPTYRIYWW